jgi:hypothetical protein
MKSQCLRAKRRVHFSKVQVELIKCVLSSAIEDKIVAYKLIEFNLLFAGNETQSMLYMTKLIYNQIHSAANNQRKTSFFIFF